MYLENPTENEVKGYVSLSNRVNFDVIPDKLVLRPMSKTPFKIRYNPS